MNWSPTAVVLLSLCAALVADQRAKRLALSRLAESPPARSDPRRVHLHIVRTPALLLPIGRQSAAALWLAMLAGVLLIASRGHAAPTMWIGLGVGLGGAAGNLFDLWRHDAVIDFIDPGWWPAFNLADVMIVAGTIAAAISSWAA